jgi:hypothetical protein
MKRNWVLGITLVFLAPASQSAELTSENAAPAKFSKTSMASLGVTIDFFPNVADISRRRDPLTDSLGNPVKSEPYSLLDSRFHLDFTWIQTENYTGALRASIQFRNAFERVDPEYPSTEYGGYSLSFVQKFGKYFQWLIQYHDRQSAGLRLVSSHRAIQNSVFFETAENTANGKASLFYLKVGPNIVFTKTYGYDRKDIYDPSWGVHAKMRLQTTDPMGYPIAFAVEGQFQRIMGYRLDNVDHGGSGLMTITPEIESMLSNDLWVGAYYHIPTLRPAGREESFNDPTLPGLYGQSGGFFVKSTSF